MDRIPPERYFSSEHMAREARMWRRVWRCAGRVDVAEPRSTDVARETSWAGFRWVHAADEPEPLEAYLAEVRLLIEAYDLASWGTELAVTTSIACNWKASVDAHNESYHVRFLHPEVVDLVDAAGAQIDLLGPHSRIRVPMCQPGVTRRPEHASLSDDQLRDNHQLYVFPNTQLNLYADHGMVFRHRPHAEDPERCWFDMFVITRRGGKRGVELREVDNADPVFGPVTGADIAMLPGLQRGMRSPGFRGLLLSEREACIRNMHAQLERYLIDT